jgi:uncharacterized protein
MKGFNAWKVIAWQVVIFGLALSATAAWAQERPAVTAQPNTVYASADGKYEAAPDTALVQFNIAAQEDTSKAAYDRASRAAQQVRDLLRTAGIDPKTAEIGFLSVQPVYDYRSPKRKLLAYRVSSNVSLKLKDFSKVGNIVQQLAELDVTENQTLSYTLENIDAAKLKAVDDAFQRARNEAATVARAGGRSLGDLSYASVDTFEPPRIFTGPMQMRAGVAGAPPLPPTEEFTPHTVTVTAHVNVVFGLK